MQAARAFYPSLVLFFYRPSLWLCKASSAAKTQKRIYRICYKTLTTPGREVLPPGNQTQSEDEWKGSCQWRRSCRAVSLAKGPTLLLEELEGPSDVIYLQLFLFLMGKGSPGGNSHLT